MSELVELWKKPAAAKSMIAGWHQWADAGSVSSGLPQYLIQLTDATQIGKIEPDGFYLFQIPGAHHFLRPVVRLKEGYRAALEQRENQFFYTGDDERGLVIFCGEEPHQNEEDYAEAFLDAVQDLGIERIAAVAGVYGQVPYDRDRDVSCVYSLPRMKGFLSQYAVRFSNYEGGATISTYLADRAEPRGIELFALYAIVPAYSFSTHTAVVQQMAMDEDFKAWYDLMRRLDRMFDLGLDLSDLKRRSGEIIETWRSQIDHLARTMPQLGVREYMENIEADSPQESADQLSDVWEEALRDLFEDDQDL